MKGRIESKRPVQLTRHRNRTNFPFSFRGERKGSSDGSPERRRFYQPDYIATIETGQGLAIGKAIESLIRRDLNRNYESLTRGANE